MKRILFILLFGLFITSCTNYNTNWITKDKPYNLMLNYMFRQYAPNDATYIEFLEKNKHFSHVCNVNNILYGTYTTNINPQSVGYDLKFYPYIDTTTIFMCKFEYHDFNTPFDRSKVCLTEFIFILPNNKTDLKTLDEYKIRDLFDILAKQAFNDFKYKPSNN